MTEDLDETFLRVYDSIGVTECKKIVKEINDRQAQKIAL